MTQKKITLDLIFEEYPDEYDQNSMRYDLVAIERTGSEIAEHETHYISDLLPESSNFHEVGNTVAEAIAGGRYKIRN